MIRQPTSETLARYAEVAQLLTGHAQATPEHGVSWVRELVRDLKIPGLSAYDVSPAQVPGIVEKATQASSMKANAIVLTPEELTTALTQAL